MKASEVVGALTVVLATVRDGSDLDEDSDAVETLFELAQAAAKEADRFAGESVLREKAEAKQAEAERARDMALGEREDALKKYRQASGEATELKHEVAKLKMELEAAQMLQKRKGLDDGSVFWKATDEQLDMLADVGAGVPDRKEAVRSVLKSRLVQLTGKGNIFDGPTCADVGKTCVHHDHIE